MPPQLRVRCRLVLTPTVHIILGDLEDLAEIAEHFVQQCACVLIGVGAERVAANTLQNAARGVWKQTHDTAAAGVDLIP